MRKSVIIPTMAWIFLALFNVPATDRLTGQTIHPGPAESISILGEEYPDECGTSCKAHTDQVRKSCLFQTEINEAVFIHNYVM